MPQFATIEETWAYLAQGIDNIMSRPYATLSFKDHTKLYTAAYDYCTSPRLAIANRPGNSDLPSSDLYGKISDYFVQYCELITEKSETLEDITFLRYYAAQWDSYNTGANSLNRVFGYLNRCWIKPKRNKGDKTVYQINTLALIRWKDILFQKEHAKLTTALLHLIDQRRNGEMTDQDLVKKIVDSFISLGLDSANPQRECLDIYKKHFEIPFINATEQYYKSESESFLARNSVSDYLKKAESRLREEGEYVYLHADTRKQLIETCEHVLIAEHSEIMWENFQDLLDSDRYEDLQRTCALLARIPGGLELLRKKFETHVKNSGLSIISKVIGEGVADIDPKAYVDALLEVHDKSLEAVTRSFKDEDGFGASLDKACREFVNRNAATETSPTKSPELIAKYADLLLRKENEMMEEDDFERALNRLMILLKYLDNKDVFQTFYNVNLFKRLVYGVSASEEREASIISKLKQEYGYLPTETEIEALNEDHKSVIQATIIRIITKVDKRSSADSRS